MNKRLRVILGTLIGTAIFYFVLKKADWAQIWAAWKQCQSFWLILSALAILAELAIKGLRWMTILEGKWAHPLTYIKATYLGLGASTFLPLRAGEFIKVFFIAKKTSRSLSKAALSVVIERSLDLSMLTLVVLMSFILQKELAFRWLNTFMGGKSVPIEILAVAGILLVTLIPVIIFTFAKAKIKEAWDYIRQRFHHYPLRLVKAFLLSVIVWCMDVIILLCVVKGFANIVTLTFSQVIFLFTVLSGAFLASLSPGALGIYEFLGLWALAQFGVPRNESLALLLASHGVMFIVLGLATLCVIIDESLNIKIKKEVVG